jgi:hypothetical protein
MRKAIQVAIVLAPLAAGCSQHPARDSTAREDAGDTSTRGASVMAANRSPTTVRNFTGTLHRTADGQWILAGDGSTGGLALDASAIASQAGALEGKRVNVVGSIRSNSAADGKQTLVVESISAAPEKPIAGAATHPSG